MKQYLDIREAMAIYGGSVAWWRKAILHRRLTSYRRGDRVIFRREDLDAYFAARCVPAVATMQTVNAA